MAQAAVLSVVDLLFYVPPVVCGGSCWSLFWYTSLYVLSSIAIILTRKRELVDLWMSCYCKCPVALRHGAVGWSAACDRGILRSYSHTFCIMI